MPRRRVHAQELQTSFAVSCLRHLKSVHDAAAPRPGSWRVLLVGHSMGGVVARAALARLAAEPGFGARLMHLVGRLVHSFDEQMLCDDSLWICEQEVRPLVLPVRKQPKHICGVSQTGQWCRWC